MKLTKKIMKEQLLDKFGTVSVPSSVTLHVAEAHDNWDYKHDAVYRQNDHKGHWKDIPEEHVLKNLNAFSHLTSEGLLYYLPAFMYWVLLQDTEDKKVKQALDSIISALSHVPQNLKEYQKKQFSLFTREQIQVCVQFLEYLVENNIQGDCYFKNSILKILERRWYRDYTFLHDEK